jgi:hypothetical protein
MKNLIQDRQIRIRHLLNKSLDQPFSTGVPRDPRVLQDHGKNIYTQVNIMSPHSRLCVFILITTTKAIYFPYLELTAYIKK